MVPFFRVDRGQAPFRCLEQVLENVVEYTSICTHVLGYTSRTQEKNNVQIPETTVGLAYAKKSYFLKLPSSQTLLADLRQSVTEINIVLARLGDVECSRRVNSTYRIYRTITELFASVIF